MRMRLFLTVFLALVFVSTQTITAFDASAKSSATKKVSADKTVKSLGKIKRKSATKSATKKRLKRANTTVSATNGKRFSAVVVNAENGDVLYEKNAEELRYPASLTKMMTLYLTFDALKKHKLSLGQGMNISEKAAGQPETNVNLRKGGVLLVEDAIEAIVVRSANDAAVVLAEQLGGTTWNFAQMMTKKARELGMKDTVFHNPNGLPDNTQYTSAYDMARLGIALRRDFPDYFKYFKTERFDFEGVTYTTHNRVMLRYPGVDGIKTGYIRASGFNLVTSVQKNGYSLVAVIMGGSSATARDDQMIEMLDRTFSDLATKRNSRVAGTSSENIEPPQQQASAL